MSNWSAEQTEKVFQEIEQKIKEGVAEGLSLDEAADRVIPRLCYLGHRVIHTFLHPDKRAKWECYSCQHQWTSKDGTRCPVCQNCRHVWEWVAEPYGPKDRACSYCGVTLKQSMGDKKFTQYIKREQAGREKNHQKDTR